MSRAGLLSSVPETRAIPVPAVRGSSMQNCPPGVGVFASVGSLADTPASSASARAPGAGARRGVAPHAGIEARGLSRSFVSVAGQDAGQLVAGADVELGEDLVQVVFDRARAHEQLGSDLGVGQAVAGQLADLGLPRGELGGGSGGAFAYPLASGTQLARGPFGEPAGAHGSEQRGGGTH